MSTSHCSSLASPSYLNFGLSMFVHYFTLLRFPVIFLFPSINAAD